MLEFVGSCAAAGDAQAASKKPKELAVKQCGVCIAPSHWYRAIVLDDNSSSRAAGATARHGSTATGGAHVARQSDLNMIPWSQDQ